MLPQGSIMIKLHPVWTYRDRLSANGEKGSSRKGLLAWLSNRATGVQPAFPPRVVVAVKALACELPCELGLPLSRLSIPEIKRNVIKRGLVASIGDTTLWRWLNEDAIRPWFHRSWIFPRDQAFEQKASRVLDLYEGVWEGNVLSPSDCVISTDEKTSIQARRRRHPTLPNSPRQVMRVEHEYKRLGAWAYLAAWDVRKGKIFGRCERKTGIVSFEKLVHNVMSQEPYCSAPRVFWIMDNGSSHRGQPCIERLQKRWPTITVVHTPIHASWLNQVEIYFSIIQRKVLTPNDFDSLCELEDRLLKFQEHYESLAKPFEWKFTRNDLAMLMSKLKSFESAKRKVA